MIFEPIFKPRIWGGFTLRTHFRKPTPSDIRIGESWELADLPSDKTRILNGRLAGMTWAELPFEVRRDWFSDIGPTKPFPLLIKLLDAREVLSVQVHPDRDTCHRMGHGDPKTECWYILAAEPEAVIYKGLHSGTTRDQLRQAIQKGTVADLLCRVPVHPGECHFIPAGTCHAIGAGLLIAEIQTPSDTTYRLFDWNRLDEKGQSRPLHINEAMESIRFDQPPNELAVRSKGIITDCEFFCTEILSLSVGQATPLDSGNTTVLIGVSGQGKIDNPDGSITSFKAGDTLLIPASMNGYMQFDVNGQVLLAHIKEQ
ncbi:MAG: mannose-6-phosphate isomerase [Phycisphaerae bacterium]|nr:mannose-6-phosphate isomerase [Phycisphaerae bacterium]